MSEKKLSSNLKPDTVVVYSKDSVTVLSEEHQTIMLINPVDAKSEKSWVESPIMVSLLFPLAVSALGAYLIYRLSFKKTQAEIAKLSTETSQLKSSFQPHALGIVSDVQKSVRETKLKGLKVLVNLSYGYYAFDNPYFEGESFIMDITEYYDNIFDNFNQAGYKKFRDFIDEYGYVYPEPIQVLLIKLNNTMSELYERYKLITSEGNTGADKQAVKFIEQLDDLFKETIQLIRSDLHLDDSLVNDFLDSYRVK